MEKKRLGRGLDALLNTDGADAAAQVALEQIDLNPNQPRKHFDDDQIVALTASVKQHGILQPIVVRPVGDRYQLVAGERRLRAARSIGLAAVPIHIVDFNDQEAFEATLVENIQRSDLNPIEKALGFTDYLKRFNMNQDQLAARLGVARSTISNLVSLLELTPEVQEGIRLNQITEAHGKLLKGIRHREKQVALFKQIVAMGLSVKATEALIRDQKAGQAEEREETAKSNAAQFKTTHVTGIETELQQKLATPVEIRLKAKDRGQIVLRFETNDDFERLLEVLRR